MKLELNSNVIGIFKAIDSFIVKNQNKYCVIGKLKKGKIDQNLFLNIAFNNSFGMTTRINQIDEIKFASSGEECLLISTICENEDHLDMLLSMNVGLELMKITIKGKD